MARTSRTVARRTGVDPTNEPSAEWGWHGTFPNATRIAGVLTAILILVMMIGPYQNRLQDFWMVPIALGILVLIVRGTIKRRHAWRK